MVFPAGAKDAFNQTATRPTQLLQLKLSSDSGVKVAKEMRPGKGCSWAVKVGGAGQEQGKWMRETETMRKIVRH